MQVDNFLYHHGIKGQKWGIRRFQNDDGTLTEEGKKRYGVGESGKMSAEGKKQYKQDRKEAMKEAKADVKQHLKEIGLNPHILDSYARIYAREAETTRYLEEKYGKTTLKDINRDKTKKAAIVIGASVAAYLGAIVAINVYQNKTSGEIGNTATSIMPPGYIKDVVGEAFDHSDILKHRNK